jgi:signal transduction histidine kinase
MPETKLNRFVKSGTAGGVGLAGMHERIREIGGNLRISSNSNGTRVRVLIPFRPVDSSEISRNWDASAATSACLSNASIYHMFTDT